MAWDDTSSLSSLGGRKVRVRVQMSDAKLYAVYIGCSMPAVEET